MRRELKIPSPEERFNTKYLQTKYPEFYEWLDKEYTNTLTGSIIEKLYQYFNDIKEPPLCGCCGKNYTRFINIKRGYLKNCSCKCAQNNPETRKKLKQTNIMRYGVPNAAQSKVIQDKMKNTCKERYGVENIFSSKEVQDKIRKVCKEKYGCENPQQNKEVKEKTKQTNLERYGVEYPQQSPEIRAKACETNMKNWGTMWTTQSNNFKEKSKRTNLERLGVEYAQQSPEVRKKTRQACLERYGFEYVAQIPQVKEKIKKTNIERYGVDYYIKILTARSPSKFETRYLDYIEEIITPKGWTLKRNYWGALEDLELDGYIPEIKKAFEFNGSYFHSIINLKDKKDKHILKTIMCARKGIELLHFWDDTPFGLGKDLIKDFIFNDSLNKYKELLYPDLSEYQWPCDLGISQEDVPYIKEHLCVHGGFDCYDSGYIEK